MIWTLYACFPINPTFVLGISNCTSLSSEVDSSYSTFAITIFALPLTPLGTWFSHAMDFNHLLPSLITHIATSPYSWDLPWFFHLGSSKILLVHSGLRLRRDLVRTGQLQLFANSRTCNLTVPVGLWFCSVLDCLVVCVEQIILDDDGLGRPHVSLYNDSQRLSRVSRFSLSFEMNMARRCARTYRPFDAPCDLVKHIL